MPFKILPLESNNQEKRNYKTKFHLDKQNEVSTRMRLQLLIKFLKIIRSDLKKQSQNPHNQILIISQNFKYLILLTIYSFTLQMS